jgi:hypothetical protein
LWTSTAPALMLGCESSACVPTGLRMFAKLKRDPDLPVISADPAFIGGGTVVTFPDFLPLLFIVASQKSSILIPVRFSFFFLYLSYSFYFFMEGLTPDLHPLTPALPTPQLYPSSPVIYIWQ